MVVLLWLDTGVYTVGPGEQGVVRRFGKQVAMTGSGLRYHWPTPIERVDIVNVEVVRRVELGFRSMPRYRQVPQESLMLTGDENIVEAQAIVQYRGEADPGAYLFRVADPDQALRDATEVGLRSVIGRTTIENVLTVASRGNPGSNPRFSAAPSRYLSGWTRGYRGEVAGGRSSRAGQRCLP